MNILANLVPTFQKTIRFVNKQIRQSKDLDPTLVKALADLTRAYLQLQSKETDPNLDGNPDYYNQMLEDAQRSARQGIKKPIKRKTLVKRK